MLILMKTIILKKFKCRNIKNTYRLTLIQSQQLKKSIRKVHRITIDRISCAFERAMALKHEQIRITME